MVNVVYNVKKGLFIINKAPKEIIKYFNELSRVNSAITVKDGIISIMTNNSTGSNNTGGNTESNSTGSNTESDNTGNKTNKKNNWIMQIKKIIQFKLCLRV